MLTGGKEIEIPFVGMSNEPKKKGRKTPGVVFLSSFLTGPKGGKRRGKRILLPSSLSGKAARRGHGGEKKKIKESLIHLFLPSCRDQQQKGGEGGE